MPTRHSAAADAPSAGRTAIVQAMSSANRPITAEATGTGKSTMRPCDRNEPMPDPTAIATAKMAR